MAMTKFCVVARHRAWPENRPGGQERVKIVYLSNQSFGAKIWLYHHGENDGSCAPQGDANEVSCSLVDQ
jgi:hypothetical protein